MVDILEDNFMGERVRKKFLARKSIILGGHCDNLLSRERTDTQGSESFRTNVGKGKRK